MRTILHCDLNHFYAAVECLYHPEVRDKPLAVCGDPGLRQGIVLAKNDLAKERGVQTGEAIWQARQKCPELVCIPPHYSRYLHYSRHAHRIYSEYTDRVEPFGLDECWLDLTGCEHLWGSGEAVAAALRQRIREELGVTVSVGVSFCKIFAKLGSDLKKLDATTVIPKEEFRAIVWPLPVADLLYVGRATQQKLARYNIYTIGQLAQTDLWFLASRLGKMGTVLWGWANGYDGAPVQAMGEGRAIRSIGNSATVPRDLHTDREAAIVLRILAESVGQRLRQQGLLCTTVQLSLRDADLLSYSHRSKLPGPTCHTGELWNVALALYREAKRDRPLRSLGLRACGLLPAVSRQMSLFDQQNEGALEETVDALRRRFGNGVIRRGLLLEDAQLASLDPQEHWIHPVSYFG
ncbi:MAG TPA: DNA polymerase IV [Firmicutes bacterium]|nr:DNA polymerase IV [Bacillota bacterium]